MFEKLRAQKVARQEARTANVVRIMRALDEAAYTGQPVRISGYEVSPTAHVVLAAYPDGTIRARQWAQVMPGMTWEYFELTETVQAPIEPMID